ncbi:uncharacterized protein K02A2.6-like [Teleopsis dalmanni]|uniref:uncharacterized protein K02A2.6-like n=1 Tax=Teleopsis dalmanni TaxID=139649 RepID=UPI0018CC8408|nr:uncharacterized protein K02A2.6-like [Teleopsis dalmanni]XP_037958974.1 uncharacterized protein K02A2.6-like [Teleopsis dalmanni]
MATVEKNQILGKLPNFDHENGSWSIYKSKLQQFLICNQVTNEIQKKAMLVTSLEERSFMLLQNLLSPKLVDAVEVTYEQCVKVLEAHFKPVTIGFAERCRFYGASKQQQESVNDWAIKLRNLATQCNFGEHLEMALRDKFIMGLERSIVKDKLMLESVETLTFEKAVQMAKAAEYSQQPLEAAVKEEIFYMRNNTSNNGRYSAAQPQRRHGQQRSEKWQHDNERQQMQKEEVKKCEVCGEELRNQFAKLFDSKLGCFTKGQVKLSVKAGSVPKFFKPRPVPLAIKDKVEKQIKDLVNMDVLEPIEFSEWATPIVPVLKKNGQVRICGDFKVTVNPVLIVDKYPLPRIEELFAKLQGGDEFTKLDLTMAYQQMELDEDSRKLTTISTTKGLFQYKRLVYGLASAPAIFQKIMENLLLKIEGVVVFIDDILITAGNRVEHVKRVKQVLSVLQDAGFSLSLEKCNFFCKKVEYLGHIIDKEGLHTNPEKIKMIKDIAYPKNLKELQAFLGMINFYRRFLPNLANIASPLYDLMKGDSQFVWTNECSKAIDKLKNLVIADKCLTHFNPEFGTKLTVDASPIGVGAVLSQVAPDGVEKPIEFASRILKPVERKYSQLDREAVAILFGVTKFHQYLYGRKFILVTDNKPLQYIFNPKKGIPQMAANRLQRIALALSGYNFQVEHIRSTQNVADYFSRFPSKIYCENKWLESDVYFNYVKESNKIQLDLELVKKETEKDKVLQKVKEYILKGWPSKCTDVDMEQYFRKKNELSYEQNCVFWAYRIVIPKSLQHRVVELLHSSHMGIVKMKSRARECSWWPKQTNDLEIAVKGCEPCLKTRADPPKQELKVWKWPDKPWSRVHIDFFGPCFKRWCLIIIDAHTKWIECIDMGRNTTSKAVIEKLQDVFARFGLPHELVSDNGTAFVSNEFKIYLKNCGIKHFTTPVGYPATNGQAENAVKTVKNALKRSLLNVDSGHFNVVLNKFLFDYRNTKHCSTGIAPATLMFGRQLRTKLDLFNPHRKVEINVNVNKIVEESQNKQKKYYGSRNNRFKENEAVMVKDYSIPGRVSWAKGYVSKKLGRQIYIVKTENGKNWKRHANQMIGCKNNFQEEENRSKLFKEPIVEENIGSKAKDIVSQNVEENIVDQKEKINYKYNLRTRKFKDNMKQL